MKLVYLKKAKTNINIFKKFFYERFVYVLKKKKDNHNIYEYHNRYDKNYTHLIRKLKRNRVTHIVICDELDNDRLTLRIQLNNIQIITGRRLLCHLAYNIFLKISDIKKEMAEKQKVYILVHEMNNVNLYNIEKIIQKASSVNIVTDNLKKFNYFAQKVQDKLGILISVSNNKCKSLRNASIIINIDYSEQQINEFNINRTAIIASLQFPIKIKKKSFCGHYINNVNIYEKDIIEKLEKIDLNILEYSSTKLIESELLEKYDANIEIKELIGNRNIPISSF